MKLLGLHTLWWHFQLMYYERALKEMDSLHEDVLHVLMQIADLKDKLSLKE